MLENGLDEKYALQKKLLFSFMKESWESIFFQKIKIDDVRLIKIDDPIII